jgi:hypothetical protein
LVLVLGHATALSSDDEFRPVELHSSTEVVWSIVIFVPFGTACLFIIFRVFMVLLFVFHICLLQLLIHAVFCLSWTLELIELEVFVRYEYFCLFFNVFYVLIWTPNNMSVWALSVLPLISYQILNYPTCCRCHTHKQLIVTFYPQNILELWSVDVSHVLWSKCMSVYHDLRNANSSKRKSPIWMKFGFLNVYTRATIEGKMTPKFLDLQGLVQCHTPLKSTKMQISQTRMVQFWQSVV